MKQQKLTSLFESIYGAQLFRDDIEEIIARMEQNSLNIEIKDSLNIYDDLDDFISHRGQNPKEIEIRGTSVNSSDSITITIRRKKAYISVLYSENMYSLGIILKELLTRKVPWHYKILNPIYIFYAFSAFPLLIILTRDKETGIVSPLTLSALGTVFTLFICSLLFRVLNHGLSLERKHEYGFWNKNKDKILLAIIGAIFGTMLTLFIQWIKK